MGRRQQNPALAKLFKKHGLSNLYKIYTSLPFMRCRRMCQEQRCGPVKLTDRELALITDWMDQPVVPCKTGQRCGFLGADGRCQIYPVRPMACRVAALTRPDRCGYGCVPDYFLTAKYAEHLKRLVEEMIGVSHYVVADGSERDT